MMKLTNQTVIILSILFVRGTNEEEKKERKKNFKKKMKNKVKN